VQQKRKKILIEFHNWNVEYSSYYFILDVLKKKYNIEEVEAFSTSPFFFSHSIFQKIKFFFGNLFKVRTFKLYKNLGINNIFMPNLNNLDSKLINKYYNIFFEIPNLNLNDILKFKINNILVGDILYDSYLKCYNCPTINIQDLRFKSFFKNFLFLYFYWNNYFKINNVKAVVVLHHTYLTGLPLRVAIAAGAKAIVANIGKIYQLNKKNIYPYKEYLNYKKKFSGFSNKNKISYLKIANKEILMKFSGDLRRMEYLLVPSFRLKTGLKENLEKSKKLKILISPHMFSDSPHFLGNSLFPDCYEWLIFLFNFSKITDYEWYIKLHPEITQVKFDNTYFIVKNLLKKYSHIKWIPPETSHNTLIKEGINFVFTVNGSIGSEYPYFNVPVINASLNNPHIKYNFNYHPKNIAQLKFLILNLNKLKKKIYKREVLEFFFMHKIFYGKSWLGINIYEFMKKNSFNYRDLYSNKNAYNILISSLYEKNFFISKVLTNFFNSKKYLLTGKFDFQ
jgi:hypothetical protein